MFVGFYYDVPPAVLTLVEHNVIMNAFAFSWSAATNVWATAMVAFKAWCVHHASLPSSFSTRVRRTWPRDQIRSKR